MRDEVNGSGMLRNLEGPPVKWRVRYQFSIGTELIRSSCIASAENGVAIPEGYYQLTAEHGETMQVQNLGIGHWTMLEPF